MSKYMLMDVSNIGYTFYYGSQRMQSTSINAENSVFYGVMKQIRYLSTHFNVKDFIFCFDSKDLYRKKLYKNYKSNRVYKPEIKNQFKTLKVDLRNMGFSNIFTKKGYEADDIISFFALKVPSLIISSDQDFYQCLSLFCSIYDIRKKIVFTEKAFKRKYKLLPLQWIKVKAIAGCSSDTVPGIKGIGEKFAIKYLRNIPFSRDHLIKNGEKDIKFYEKLVKLPYSPALNVKLNQNTLSIKKIQKVFKKNNYPNLLNSESLLKWRKTIKTLNNL